MVSILGLTLLVLVAAVIFLGLIAVIMYEVRAIVRSSRELAAPPPPPFFPDTWPAVDPTQDHLLN